MPHSAPLNHHHQVWSVSSPSSGGAQRGGKAASATAAASYPLQTLVGRSVSLREHKGSAFVDVRPAPAQPGHPAGSDGVYALTGDGTLVLLRATARNVDKSVSLQVRRGWLRWGLWLLG